MTGLRGRRVLVTGGLGFIGHHLSEVLLQRGAAVTIVDDLRSNVVEAGYFASDARVETTSFRDFDDERAFDILFHLASPVGPVRVMTAHGDVAAAIVGDVHHAIERYARAGTRVVYVSTSEVYGTGLRGDETQHLVVRTPFSGRREYACAKLLGEVMLANAARTGAAPSLIIRPFNVVGPRQSPEGGFVLARFVTAALANEALTVYGTGEQRRCFTHVFDVVEAIVELVTCGVTGVLNVANPENETTINALARSFVRTFEAACPDSRIVTTWVDANELHGTLYEEAPDKLPSVDRLFAATSWRPSRGLETILRDVIDSELASFKPSFAGVNQA